MFRGQITESNDSIEDIFENAMQLYGDFLPLSKDFTTFYYQCCRTGNPADIEMMKTKLTHFATIHAKILSLLTSIKNQHPDAQKILIRNKKITREISHQKSELVFAITHLREWFYPELDRAYAKREEALKISNIYSKKNNKSNSALEEAELSDADIDSERKAKKEQNLELKAFSLATSLAHLQNKDLVPKYRDIFSPVTKELRAANVSEVKINQIIQNVTLSIKSEHEITQFKRKSDPLLGARSDSFTARQKIFGMTQVTKRRASLTYEGSVEEYVNIHSNNLGNSKF